ncbi:hypothetical protein CPB85DRAFT_537116 [Mucidula mucida]|nr:hypothetical protein CPB85DRAFT_537116 [Mucidula mucida]
MDCIRVFNACARNSLSGYVPLGWMMSNGVAIAPPLQAAYAELPLILTLYFLGSRTTLNDFLWTGPQEPACLSGPLLPAISAVFSCLCQAIATDHHHRRCTHIRQRLPSISLFGVCGGLYFGYVPGEGRRSTRGYGLSTGLAPVIFLNGLDHFRISD